MKLLVLSDLHLEFRSFVPDLAAIRACDVVVLAGDIHLGGQAIRWAAETFSEKPIVMVAGNHEFYRGHWDSTLAEMRQEAQRLGVHFLENDEVTIGGVRFLGCTLWIDFMYFGEAAQPESMRRYEQGLNDCRRIAATDPEHGNRSSLKPELVLSRHKDSRNWLETALLQPSSGKTVVVTHYLPVAECVSPRFRQDSLTPGFASRLPDDLVGRADLWIHGHTHDSVDLQSSPTRPRIVCNPRGYPINGHDENRAFRDDLIIEL